MMQKLRVTENFLGRAAADFARISNETGHTEFHDGAFWFYVSSEGALRVFHEYRNSNKAGIGYDAKRGSYYVKLETPNFEGELGTASEARRLPAEATGAVKTGNPAPDSRHGETSPHGIGDKPVSGPIVRTVLEIERELGKGGLEGEAYLQRAKELLDESGYKFTNTPCICPHGAEHGHHFACGYSVPTYYSVGGNRTWTNAPAPKAFFTSRGASATESRRHPEGSGILTLWIEGQNVGTLFPRQSDQIAFLNSKGWLEPETASAELPKPTESRASVRR